MGKIYAPPEEFKLPKVISGGDIQEYFKKCEEYAQNIKDWAKENGDCPEAGKEIRFPVADGYARYVVYSLKPVKLIHLNVGDAWQYQYAHRLTAADIRKEVKKIKGGMKLFGQS
jgi:hypothetical protein